MNRKFCVLGKLNMKMMERCNDHLGFYSKQKMPPFYTVADFFLWKVNFYILTEFEFLVKVMQ